MSGDSRERRGETFVMGSETESVEPIDFKTFLLGLASTILIHLGEVPHPEAGNVEKDLPLARQSLDVLSLLKEKTRGNLTPDEEKFFEAMLSDLRLRFVQAGTR